MNVELAVIGLGNPGPDYAGTRHNLGFEVLQRLASRFGQPPPSQKHHGLILLGRIEGVSVALVQPMTHVNRSGDCVRAVAELYALPPSRLWVVVDDFQIPLGTLRIRKQGSDGGHNGLSSIIAALGTIAFPRFRLGVGSPPEGVSTVDYVLGRFTADEEEIVKRLLDHATKAVEVSVREGLGLGMSRFNGSVVPDDEE